MNYTEEFIQNVLSLVPNEEVKYLILSGQMSIGEFLTEYSAKGVDSKVILDCLEKNDLDALERLALQQERIKEYFQEWQECYLFRRGPINKQDIINKELELMYGGKNSSLNLKYIDKIDKQRKLAQNGIYDNNSVLVSLENTSARVLSRTKK